VCCSDPTHSRLSGSENGLLLVGCDNFKDQLKDLAAFTGLGADQIILDETSDRGVYLRVNYTSYYCRRELTNNNTIDQWSVLFVCLLSTKLLCDGVFQTSNLVYLESAVDAKSTMKRAWSLRYQGTADNGPAKTCSSTYLQFTLTLVCTCA
jgi:hypothetical protein